MLVLPQQTLMSTLMNPLSPRKVVFKIAVNAKEVEVLQYVGPTFVTRFQTSCHLKIHRVNNQTFPRMLQAKLQQASSAANELR